VLVVEGDIKSGALITARLALEEGRSVYAVPGNIFNPGSQGPHYLIRNGAAPVSSGADIMEDLHWQAGDGKQQTLFAAGAGTDPASSPSAVLSDAERQLLDRIPYDPLPLERLREITGLTSAGLNERLTLLELEGVIVLLPGAHVCRK
jgi:DNA processing protein